jgi:hypothetical protein
MKVRMKNTPATSAVLLVEFTCTPRGDLLVDGMAPGFI